LSPGRASAGEPRRIAVALGSNLGDRAAHLTFAARHLRDVLDDVIVSPYVESEPEGGADQPPYLNAAAVGRSAAAPVELLRRFLAIEHEAGRRRPFPQAPRTLDLDLILAGEIVLLRPDLEVPHPRFRRRRFVLEPLAAIAPDLVDPVSGRTVGELLADLNAMGPGPPASGAGPG
jgi:2-amino-4-hydroxy-6-hydroxymethyldihydropteridine diphosphokinase